MGKRKGSLTDEQEAWLRKAIPGHWAKDVADEFNKVFNANLSYERLRSWMRNHGVNSGAKSLCKPYWAKKMTTPEQDEILKAAYVGKTIEELRQYAEAQLGLKWTYEQTKAYLARRRFKSGHTGYFEKGREPLNKGKKMDPEVKERIKHTFFKKGHVPMNWKPVGSERISVDGYIEVKVKEPRTWRLKSRVVYEEYHKVKLKRDDYVVYLDGDRLNLDISNLALISQAECAILNKRRLRSEFPQITESGIALAKLIIATRKREKGIKNDS